MPRAVAIVIAALFLAGCTSTGAQPGSAHVTGTVTYRERSVLPPAATIRIQVVDVSRADAPAILVGERIIEVGTKQAPFGFEISYDPARIESNHTYAVHARIEVDGRLWFVSDTHYPVITRGAPTHVDLVLKAVGGPAAN